MNINKNFIEYCRSHNWLDEAIKDQSINELNGLFKLLKIPEKATKFYRTEFTTLLGGERRCDLVCRTGKNYMLNIEASYNIPRYWDISRQITYGMRIHMSEWRENPHHPKWKNTENFQPIESIFITAQKTSKKEMNVNLKRKCPSLGSQIYTFKDINYQRYIKQIKNKISKGKKINYEEIALLKFIPLIINKKEIPEALIEAINLLKQDKTIDKEIMDKIILIYIRNTILYIDEKEYQNQILEELKMQLTSLNNFEEYVRIKSTKEGKSQGIEEGRRQGIKEGMEEGRVQGIKEGIKEGMEEGRVQGIKEGIKEERNKIEKLLELENIPKETINKIMNKSKENII